MLRLDIDSTFGQIVTATEFLIHTKQLCEQE